MSIPSYYDFIPPLLIVLARSPEGLRSGEAADRVADVLGLEEEAREQRVPSGKQPVYRNRSGWAHDRLKRDGLSHCPQRGHWQLTPAGIALAKKYPEGIPEAEKIRLHELGRFGDGGKPLGSSGMEQALPTAAEKTALETPEEAIARGLEEIRRSVAEDLLDILKDMNPYGFEDLVLDLLHHMGYGTSKSDLQRTRSSQDEGIDGIISLDGLGLEKVYVQAKRWKSMVGRPEIQAFFGALAGKRAKKGVFITTSGYSREATQYASDVSDSIVLVDGDQLARYMIDFEVGVSSEVRRIPSIDTDYFER